MKEGGSHGRPRAPRAHATWKRLLTTIGTIANRGPPACSAFGDGDRHDRDLPALQSPSGANPQQLSVAQHLRIAL